MAVTVPNAELATGVVATYDDFAALLDGLDDTAWRAPTRCAGWEVRDVASHVVGLAADAISGAPGGRTPDEHAAALRHHSPDELAGQLRVSVDAFRSFLGALDDAAWNTESPVPGMSLSRGISGLWFDTWVHLDDARRALELPEDRGPGLAASAIFVTQRLEEDGWGPATIALDGIEKIAIGTGGPNVTGDPYQFVMVGSGRADPATLGLDETVDIYRDE